MDIAKQQIHDFSKSILIVLGQSLPTCLVVLGLISAASGWGFWDMLNDMFLESQPISSLLEMVLSD